MTFSALLLVAAVAVPKAEFVLEHLQELESDDLVYDLGPDGPYGALPFGGGWEEVNPREGATLSCDLQGCGSYLFKDKHFRETVGKYLKTARSSKMTTKPLLLLLSEKTPASDYRRVLGVAHKSGEPVFIVYRNGGSALPPMPKVSASWSADAKKRLTDAKSLGYREVFRLLADEKFAAAKGCDAVKKVFDEVRIVYGTERAKILEERLEEDAVAKAFEGCGLTAGEIAYLFRLQISGLAEKTVKFLGKEIHLKKAKGQGPVYLGTWGELAHWVALKKENFANVGY